MKLEIIHRVLAAALLAAALAGEAAAQVNARIADVARLKGPRVNRLQGMGLVVGLDGTGDGGDYQRTIEPLANLLKHYANPTLDLEELKDTENVALVMIQADLPEDGGREGDRLDVQVAALGNCKSLLGGRLISSPMQHHSLVDQTVVGFAMGPLQLLDPNTTTTATVRDGLVLEENVLISYVASGSELQTIFRNDWLEAGQRYVTFVVDDAHAGWGMTAAIAEAINEGPGVSFNDAQMAMAMDARNVVVRIPEVQGDDIVPLLRDIEVLSTLMPERGSQILINRTKKVIIVDGEVQISPVTFSVGGLTIDVYVDEQGEMQPAGPQKMNFVKLDPAGQGGATLNSLVQQLNQIKVPIDDRIAVIEELQRMGKIHAQVIFEE